MNPEQKRLMHILQILQFAAIDLTLYLDTHPNDKRALAEYNEVSRRFQEAKLDYEKRFGALMSFGHNHPQSEWTWLNEPWPWEVCD